MGCRVAVAIPCHSQIVEETSPISKSIHCLHLSVTVWFPQEINAAVAYAIVKQFSLVNSPPALAAWLSAGHPPQRNCAAGTVTSQQRQWLSPLLAWKARELQSWAGKSNWGNIPEGLPCAHAFPWTATFRVTGWLAAPCTGLWSDILMLLAIKTHLIQLLISFQWYCSYQYFHTRLPRRPGRGCAW